VKVIEGVFMHRTIEALYKNGKIIPTGDFIPVRKARVLITFIDDDKLMAPVKKRVWKFKTYRCGGTLKDFSREDAYETRI